MCDYQTETTETTVDADAKMKPASLDAAELKTKKASRKGHRSSATKMINQVDPAIAAVNAPKLKQLRAQLTTKSKLLSGLDAEIIAHIADDEIETEVEQTDQVQEKISLALYRIEEALEEIAVVIKWRRMQRSPLPPQPFEYEDVSNLQDSSTPPPEDEVTDNSTIPAMNSHDPLTAPATSHVPLTAPATSHVPLTAPVALHDPLTAPATSHVPLTAPVALHDPLTAPVALHDPLTAPVALHDPLTAPVISHDYLTAPVATYDPLTVPVPSPRHVHWILPGASAAYTPPNAPDTPGAVAYTSPTSPITATTLVHPTTLSTFPIWHDPSFIYPGVTSSLSYPGHAPLLTHSGAPTHASSSTHSGVPIHASPSTHSGAPIHASLSTHSGVPSHVPSSTYSGVPIHASPSTHSGAPIHDSLSTHSGVPSHVPSSTYSGVHSHVSPSTYSGAPIHTSPSTHSGVPIHASLSTHSGVPSHVPSSTYSGVHSHVSPSTYSGAPIHASPSTHSGAPIHDSLSTHSGVPSHVPSSTYSGVHSHVSPSTYSGVPIHASPSTHSGVPIHASPSTHSGVPIHASPSTHSGVPIHASPSTHSGAPIHASLSTHSGVTSHVPSSTYSGVHSHVSPLTYSGVPIHASPSTHSGVPIHASPSTHSGVPIHASPSTHSGVPIHAFPSTHSGAHSFVPLSTHTGVTSLVTHPDAVDHAYPGTVIHAPTTLPDRVKLPKLSLPHFNGNLMKWTSFWDSFDSAVHTNDRLPEVDKFNHLRSLLEGTARDAISGMSMTASNYREAVEILKKRFGNRQLIISKHMDALLHVSAVTSDGHLRELRRLYDQSEANIRSLKALGVESGSYGAMLSSVLLNKLPPELRLIVSRKISADKLDMDNLLETFELELSARERANSSIPHSHPRHRQQERTPTSAFPANVNDSTKCIFCQQSHPSTNCRVVTDINKRKKILRESSRCYNCLRKGHVSRLCRSAAKCKLCQGRHHTTICEKNSTPATDQPGKSPLNPKAQPYSPGSSSSTPTTTTFCSAKRRGILLQTALTKIHNLSRPRSAIKLRVLFDTGSQRSYLTERAMKLLKLKATDTQTLSIATFGAKRGQDRICPIVSVGMRLRERSTMNLTLYVVPSICEPITCQSIDTSITANEQLMTLDLADPTDGTSDLPIDLLIGCDYYWDLVTGDICRTGTGPTAIHTKLGWVLSGPTVTSESSITHTAITHQLQVDCQLMNDEPLEDQLRAFWEIESFGISQQENACSLYEQFTKSVSLQDGRYQVCLPWKEFHKPLADNYQLSLKRLKGLLKRLRHDPKIMEEYDLTIKEQLSKGIIESVNPEDKTAEPVHYLPHHGVVRSDKLTTKLRVVYDASAKDSGPSLNECLYKGPKFHQIIFDILLRFRFYPIALTADVEKAFLMIQMDERDRDALRFFWVDDITKEEPEIRIYRFTRVMFGISSSPFLLNATIKYHLDKYLDSDRAVVECLQRSTYVDDVITGANTETDALMIYNQSKAIFREGGFNLRKFQTNSPTLQKKINIAEGTSVTERSGEFSTVSPEMKVLGVTWNHVTDELVFDPSDLALVGEKLLPTKRNAVSLIGRFYDPLGYLSPITIRFKVFFQKLCKAKLEWDSELPACESLREWKTLLADLKIANPVSIPRCYISSGDVSLNNYKLYGFCDASNHAYAAVIYLVVEAEIYTEVKLLASKTRVAPVQTQTIPRLELLSALLLSRLITTVMKALSCTIPQLTLQRCYTDSLVSLFWIQGTEKEWRPFVNNRVREIRSLINPENWRHCPGSSNPADLPSRGASAVELSENKLWWNGPPWLAAGAEPHDTNKTMPTECEVELKRKIHGMVSVEVNSNKDVESIMDPLRYSSMLKLLRVTATVVRAVRKFKGKWSEGEEGAEQREAECLWIVSAQKRLPDKGSLMKQLNTFRDEQGVWRCAGRLGNTDLQPSAKSPILLPKNHWFTTLAIRSAHQRVLHDGVKETLTEVRTKYWIPHGRSTVRKTIHSCVTCRRYEGLPYKTPAPPPLPKCRVEEAPAFSYTGVDFAGPILIRVSKSQSAKAWIALFTCYVTRAIHLEAVTDQLTPTFLRCLKKFVARRGLPKQFISDNGKTFKSTAKYLETVVKDKTVQAYLSGLSITWQFNVELAPWWGGAFERLVKSTKRCLRKQVGRANFSLDELITSLAEIEAVINSRPLSYVSSDDLEEPITPSHLITGHRILNLPDDLNHLIDFKDEDFSLTRNQATARVKHLNNVLNQFWKRWRTEYLSELREVHAHTAKKRYRGEKTKVSIGQVVIVKDEHLPRGLWKLGFIQRLLTGKDGKTRAAIVRVVSRDRQHTTLNRPIQLLYPLELHCDSSEIETKSDIAEDSSPELPEEQELTSRPRRAAAKRADELRKKWIEAEMEVEDDMKLD